MSLPKWAGLKGFEDHKDQVVWLANLDELNPLITTELVLRQRHPDEQQIQE